MIRNGQIIDGKIAAIGEGLANGAEEIDATGMIVTPGFVDIHTHYDGHVTWENRLKPPSFHGITTVVIGNCGVGFAPCQAEEQDSLIRLMEGVEDIPFPVLKTGLPRVPTTWTSPVTFLTPPCASTSWASAVEREPATAADIDRMRNLLGEALDAGATGIGTSRTLFHRSSDGKAIPTLDAEEAETLRAHGHGAWQAHRRKPRCQESPT